MDPTAGKIGEVGARVLSFGRKRLTGMGLRLGRWMPGDAPMSQNKRRRASCEIQPRAMLRTKVEGYRTT